MKYILLSALILFSLSGMAQHVKVGAKHFNEGYIISEIISQLLEDNGYKVERVYNLGGTLICFEALRNGAIDLYPEYTGTISSEILLSKDKISIEEIKKQLSAKFSMEISSGLGFSNSYGLVMTQSKADLKNIFSISDLRQHPELKVGLSYEFLKRQDGWDPLAKIYGLSFQVAGLEHGLAYEALQRNNIDVTDAYTTDGEIAQYHLTVLKDDAHFFPPYQAVSLYSQALDPKIKSILEKLSGKLSENDIQKLNSQALFDKTTFGDIAHEFLTNQKLLSSSKYSSSSLGAEILSKTGTHLALTFISLFLAIFVAVPLGVFLYWNPSLSKPIVYLTGLLQTIPSIALLAIMIPLVGIGITPALIALFLYALLPILRNTITGLQSVDPLLKKVSEGMGLNRVQQLYWIELPLASPVILSGIRTASVINVGTATLAAFIGAGGLGEFIVTGLALNNSQMILQGAIPAALLAILIELLFELIGRRMIPKHLRSKGAN